MKKTYSKPVIVFESFQLATSIAGGCAKGTEPPVDVGGFIVFTNDNCNTLPEEGKDYNVCYHVPTEDNNVFSS